MLFPTSEQTVLNSDGLVIDALAAKDGNLFISLTTDSVTLWHTETLLLLHSIRRVTASLESTGFNRRLYLRDDSKILIIQTTANVLLVYDLCEDAVAGVRVYETPTFSGAPRVWLKHRQNIRVEAGIQAVCITREHLVISTRKPAMIQSLRWVNEEQAEPVSTMMAKLPFLVEFTEKSHPTGRVSEMIYCASLNLFLWITSSGDIFIAYMLDESWYGSILHEHTNDASRVLLAAFNSVANIASISLVNGRIIDYVLERPAEQGTTSEEGKVLDLSSSLGAIRYLEWSTSGQVLLVLCSTGWVLASLRGCIVAESEMHGKTGTSETADVADQLRTACWLTNMQSILFVPMNANTLSLTHFCTSGISNRSENEQTPFLQFRNRLSLSAAFNEDGRDTLEPQWEHCSIPSEVSEMGIIRFVSLSTDTQHLLVARSHGFSFYSRKTHKWSTFKDINDALEFTLTIQPVWYRHLVVVAVLTSSGTHEIRLHSRRAQPEDIIDRIIVTSPVKLMMNKAECIYTIDESDCINEYQIVQQKDHIKLVFRRQFALSPMTFEEISHSQNVSLLCQHGAGLSPPTLALLSQTRLTLIEPSDSGTGSCACTLAEDVEWFQAVFGIGPMRNAIFAFDGRAIKVWLNVLGAEWNHRKMSPSASFLIDFYPMYICPETGMLQGLEVSQTSATDEAARRWVINDSARGFIPELLESLLRSDHLGDALVIAGRYTQFDHFSNFLEILLFKALEDELEMHAGLLKKSWSFLQNYQELIPKVVVSCARKSEMATWQTLFDVVGEPIHFYNLSLQNSDLKTASAYLLIIHTMNQNLNHEEYTLDLLRSALNARQWELSKDITRFYCRVADDRDRAIERVQTLAIEVQKGSQKPG